MTSCAYQTSAQFSICLAGNPNAGKTSLFNSLTGSNQHVGNWPGVTVEHKEGILEGNGKHITITDLPGTYNLTPTIDSSQDERIAASYLWQNPNEIVLAVVDAANLQRNLFLTYQLIEQQRPMLLVLTKSDSLAKQDKTIDVDALSKELGIPCTAINSRDKADIRHLREWIFEHIEIAHHARQQVEWPAAIRDAITTLQVALPNVTDAQAVGLLDNNEVLAQHMPILVPIAQEACDTVKRTTKKDVDVLIAETRYDNIEALTAKVLVSATEQTRQTLTQVLDSFALNRYLGLPVFLFMMYLMFTFAVNGGAVFIDFFDIAAATLFIDLPTFYLEALNAPALLISFVQGVGGGVQTVATFIPVVAFLFFAMTALEDSGYLARAAFVVDRVMRVLSLPGRAFVPMLLGFGCNVPAIMAARTLTDVNDRKLVVCMTPFMSCTARLPVFVMIAVALFPDSGNSVVAAMYFIGILFAMMSGWLIRKTLLPGRYTPLVMELPHYQIPHLRSLIFHSWHRLKSFIVDAGKIIVVMVMVITMLNTIGTDGSIGNEDSEQSVLAVAAKALTPALAPIGIQEDNWPATVGIVTGLLAKEAVAGTLTNLYEGLAVQGNGTTADDFSVLAGLKEALQSIPDNIVGLSDAVVDPIGMAGAQADMQTSYEEHKPGFALMATLFASSASAFAFMLFILLYTPCAAALGAIKKELNTQWMIFLSFWTLGLAWSVATLYYQFSQLFITPVVSLSWIAGNAVLWGIVLFVMYRIRKRRYHNIIAIAG